MQHQSGRRALALVAALALGTAGSALAQDTADMGRARMDTTQPAAGAIDTAGTDTSAVRDTTDTSGVAKPPGLSRHGTGHDAGHDANPGAAWHQWQPPERQRRRGRRRRLSLRSGRQQPTARSRVSVRLSF